MDIRRETWEKFVFLTGLSATTSTMRVPIGPIRENPQSRALLLDLMREVVAVGRAHGVPLPEDYAEQRLEFVDGVSPDMTSSMHHDLERGQQLEVPWLSGGVVKLGQEVGVETPLNRAVADILSVARERAQGGGEGRSSYVGRTRLPPAGLGVHIGARVSALARANEVLVSSTLRDLVIGSGLGFEERGAHQLKGVPGEWHLSAVTST